MITLFSAFTVSPTLYAYSHRDYYYPRVRAKRPNVSIAIVEDT